MIVPANECKEKIKKYEEFWSKIRALIRSIIEDAMIKNIWKSNLIQMTSYP